MILNDLLNEPVSKFNTITRFQGNDFIGDKESIAQHSFWVVLICDIIHDKLFLASELKDELYKKLIRKSIYHEFDEVLIGNDITHPLKYNLHHGEKLREIIDSIVLDLASKSTDGFSEIYYKEVLKVEKTDMIEIITSKIIKIADWLSFLAVCVNQYNIGNKSVITMRNIGVKKCLIVIDEFEKILCMTSYRFEPEFFVLLKKELMELETLQK